MIKDFLLRITPFSWRFIAIDIKNRIWGGFRETHYSQNGEDIAVGKIFSGQAKGFYVDVGAHHPKRYSNTYLLYKRGWRGINIDPNPLTIKLFNRYRKGDINVQCGVSDEKKEMDYYNFSDPAVNTFSPNEAAVLSGKKWLKLLDIKKVSVRPLGELLEQYVPAGTNVDLLNVDTEGLDIEVLRSNNWNKFRQKAIIVEDHSFSPDDPHQSAVYAFLSDRYRLHSFMNFSLIFIEKI